VQYPLRSCVGDPLRKPEHVDPDRKISRNADPLVEYTNYLSDVKSGMVGDMGFTLEDFELYIASLQRRPLG
jgi:hypothetical protein